MKRRQKLLTDEQWELIAIPEAQAASGRQGTAPRSESHLFRGHSVDSANRCGVAVFAGRVSLALDLLAAVAAVARGRRLARCLAGPAGRVGRGRVAALGRDLSRRQLRSGEKRGLAVGKTKRGKGTKWMILADGEGVALGVRLESASPAEVTLAERVIADKGYDSDRLRERLRNRGIDLIAPYRSNNRERRYEDRRKLRRYKRRWIVERTNAWLGQFRRLLVRHDYLLSTYYAFFYLACFWITLRRYS